jgi:hypothetical protein
MPDAKKILSQDLRWNKIQIDPTCSHCGIRKTPSDFPRNAVDYWCSACRRDYARNAWRAKLATLSPEGLAEMRAKVNDRQSRQRAERIDAMTPIEEVIWRDRINEGNYTSRQKARDQVYAAYGGYVCACCGETEPAFLTIDHVNNDGAAHKREFSLKTGDQMHRWVIRMGFPQGFQVLCMNCNWAKRYNGICPHQAGKVQRSSREGVGPSGPKRSAPFSKVKPYSKIRKRVMI